MSKLKEDERKMWLIQKTDKLTDEISTLLRNGFNEGCLTVKSKRARLRKYLDELHYLLKVKQLEIEFP